MLRRSVAACPAATNNESTPFISRIYIYQGSACLLLMISFAGAAVLNFSSVYSDAALVSASRRGVPDRAGLRKSVTVLADW